MTPPSRAPADRQDLADDPGQRSAAGPRDIPWFVALIPVAVLVALLVGVLVGLKSLDPQFRASGHLPLLCAAAVAGLVARAYGWRWHTLQEGMMAGIGVAMPAILILLTIGMLMGTWLAAGIVPAFVDWGLSLLHPRVFLPASCLVCSVVSLVTGSSWSTAGTVGLALIGVGTTLGIDPGWCAGAVISGAYMGDKLSPMSDTTNLAPAMAGTELFVHVRHMLWTTLPAWSIAMAVYTTVGLMTPLAGDPAELAAIRDGLAESFHPGLRHLLVPAVIGVMVWREVPPLPTLAAATLLGGLFAVASGEEVTRVVSAAMHGYVPQTGDPRLNELLARGGMSAMSDTVLLILCAMIFGGVMERTGMLRAIGLRLLAAAKTTGSLIAATVATCIAMNVLAADQYIALVVPGRMFASAYRERGLHPKNLSRALEDSGTITSVLVPWNTCGAFMSTTLAVPTLSYMPYCIFNWVCPIISVVYGYTGLSIVSIEPPDLDPPPRVPEPVR